MEDGRTELLYSELSDLHRACQFGKLRSVQTILDSFPRDKDYPPYLDVNTIDVGGGYSPLHIAAMNGHEELCTMLVNKYGFHILTEDNTHKTAIDWAMEGQHYGIARNLSEIIGLPLPYIPGEQDEEEEYASGSEYSGSSYSSDGLTDDVGEDEVDQYEEDIPLPEYGEDVPMPELVDISQYAAGKTIYDEQEEQNIGDTTEELQQNEFEEPADHAQYGAAKTIFDEQEDQDIVDTAEELKQHEEPEHGVTEEPVQPSAHESAAAGEDQVRAHQEQENGQIPVSECEGKDSVTEIKVIPSVNVEEKQYPPSETAAVTVEEWGRSERKEPVNQAKRKTRSRQASATTSNSMQGFTGASFEETSFGFSDANNKIKEVITEYFGTKHRFARYPSFWSKRIFKRKVSISDALKQGSKRTPEVIRGLAIRAFLDSHPDIQNIPQSHVVEKFRYPGSTF